MKRTKRLSSALLGSILGAGLLWSVPALVQAEALPTAQVERLEVPRIFRLDGIVEASSSGTIAAQTGGQIKVIHFDVDEVVSKGDVLMLLDDTEQQAALESAQANLKAALARRVKAETEHARMAKVYEKKAVSKSAFDGTLAARKEARAGVEAAEAAVRQARQQLLYTKVVAPYSGVVTERHVDVGEIAAPGQALMSGISLDALRVNVEVPQALVAAVRAERDAAIFLRGVWRPVEKVTIFPVADKRTDTFRVRLALPEGLENIFPGMYVKVAFSIGLREVIAVPAEAVVYRSEVVGAYVLDSDGKVILRHIRTGSRLADGRYVVLSGLDVGESVIIEPQAAVEELKAQRVNRNDLGEPDSDG